KDCALFVFEQLETPLQRELLESFTGEFCREMLEELDPDDRAALLDEMPAKVAKSLLSLLSPEERKVTNMLMGYQPETAGRIMTPEFITLYRTMTAAQALEKIRRQAPNKEIIYVLYVTDDHKMLEGVISLKDILIADPDKKIEEIMSDSVIKVATDTDQEKAAQLLKEFDFMALPVVDKEGRIVGIITHDDAMDILEHEATEDIFNQAGFADIAGKETNRSEALVRGGLPRVWWIRLPYLLVALIAGLLTGIVIGEFEEILKIVPLIFVFVPVIMDMSGSVGTQSTTLFVRGVSLGHIDTRRFSKHLARESIVGLTMGLILGGLAGVIAAIWGHIAIGSGTLGLAVGLSVFASMTIAAILGFLVPFILLKLKLDQAAGATPLITVIKDMISITIYFLFCNLFLGYLLIV
ncbi:MAG: magnesium transporter, partial [Firmicutes bacterium]|nr:magnesium transporter [Bacillota bacterium]